MYVKRIIEESVKKSILSFPVTAILGPRQCGKSTLVKEILKSEDHIALDLERPSDLEKLRDAEWFLSTQKGKIIFLDEIQRKKELFPLIRVLVDEWEGNSHFVITGSASPELLRQSSESLAGRISYHTLMPFIWDEVKHICSLEEFILKGGFPRSVLEKELEVSFEWRSSFIRTFLERDLAVWRGFSSSSMQRLWQMLAHYNGQNINYSALGNSLGMSHSSIRNYIDLLKSTFMIDLIPPTSSNFGKRLVKSPRLYVNDSGLVNALLYLDRYEKIVSHPVFGSLWENMVYLQLRTHFPKANVSYYLTTNGAELDFIVEIGKYKFGIECKNSMTPRLSKGNHLAMNDVNCDLNLVVAPVSNSWSMRDGIQVLNTTALINQINIHL